MLGIDAGEVVQSDATGFRDNDLVGKFSLALDLSDSVSYRNIEPFHLRDPQIKHDVPVPSWIFAVWKVDQKALTVNGVFGLKLLRPLIRTGSLFEWASLHGDHALRLWKPWPFSFFLVFDFLVSCHEIVYRGVSC